MSEGSEKKLLMLRGHLSPATAQLPVHADRKVLSHTRPGTGCLPGVEWALGKIPLGGQDVATRE